MLKEVICILLASIFLMPVIPLTQQLSEKGMKSISIDYPYNENFTFLSISDDELDQQQTETGGAAILCGQWMWAQSFIPTLPVLTRIELLVYKRGIVNDLTISIRKYLYGDDLVSITRNSSDISMNPEWIEFDFGDIDIIPNETYYIVISTTGGDNKENYYVILHSKDDVYPYGEGLIGWYSGKEWKIWTPEFDFCFKTYGIREEYHEREPKEKWTYMLYDDADFENAYDPLDDFAIEAWSGKGFNAVVLQDTNDGPAKIWYIDKYHHKKLLKEMGELNMGNYITLRDFINYCKQNFPADKYIMDMYNHGGGWRGACWDYTDNNDWLTMDEIGKAIQEAGGIDILMFNAPCLMGNFEAVYELRNVVDVYIGSEELSGYKLGIVSQICELLNHNYEGIDSYEVGKNIIKYVGSLGGYSAYRTMSAVKTDKIDELADAVNKLAKDMLLKWPKCFNKIKEAHKNTMKFGMRYANIYQLYDIYDFSQKLMKAGVDPKIEKDIKNLQYAFNETIIAECHGSFEQRAHGLSIYFPDQLMDGLTIDYDKSYGLDFPKDTAWNEFLGMYVLSCTLFP